VARTGILLSQGAQKNSYFGLGLMMKVILKQLFLPKLSGKNLQVSTALGARNRRIASGLSVEYIHRLRDLV
jgi:hypothetical protein